MTVAIIAGAGAQPVALAACDRSVHTANRLGCAEDTQGCPRSLGVLGATPPAHRAEAGAQRGPLGAGN